MSLLPVPAATHTLGPGGKLVSRLAWGMWRFEGDDTNAAQGLVEAAFAVGITLFDTADIYGFNGSGGFGDAERLLGKVFKAAPHLREKMVLATKGGIMPPLPYDSSHGYLMSALEASLTRLGVDHVDLWQVHRPDVLAHPQELARTLEDMVTSGKASAVGVSNFTQGQVESLHRFLPIPLTSIQPEISALAIEPIEGGLLDQAMRLGTTVLAWSPLGQGRIAQPTTKRELDVACALDAVATMHGVSRTAAAYSWLMAHPAGIIPIVGSQQPARITEAADAYKVRWSRTDWYKVLTAARQEPLP
jgi:predicted oxidoreductase